MTIDEIRALLNDIESDRVERTISTTNTDKFGQAICAFANDLPDHRLPGYLFLGVTDDGAVMVTEMKSPSGERALQEAIAQGFVTEKGQKTSKKQPKKPSKKPSKLKVSKFPAPIVEEVYKAIKLNRKAKYSWLQDNLGVSESTILRAISDLKELGYINKEHSKIKGEWQLLK